MRIQRNFGNHFRSEATRLKREPSRAVKIDGEECLLIPLTRGKYALINESDYSLVKDYTWFCSSDGYAVRNGNRNGEPRWVRMHRLICPSSDGMETDHINLDRLDNRRRNLRSVDRRTNVLNRRIDPRNKSGRRGVSWDRDCEKWTVRIRINKKAVYLGIYDNLEDAIRVREEAELTHYGMILGGELSTRPV